MRPGREGTGAARPRQAGTPCRAPISAVGCSPGQITPPASLHPRRGLCRGPRGLLGHPWGAVASESVRCAFDRVASLPRGTAAAALPFLGLPGTLPGAPGGPARGSQGPFPGLLAGAGRSGSSAERGPRVPSCPEGAPAPGRDTQGWGRPGARDPVPSCRYSLEHRAQCTRGTAVLVSFDSPGWPAVSSCFPLFAPRQVTEIPNRIASTRRVLLHSAVLQNTY